MKKLKINVKFRNSEQAQVQDIINFFARRGEKVKRSDARKIFLEIQQIEITNAIDELIAEGKIEFVGYKKSTKEPLYRSC